jgi:chaperonin GroES
MKLIPLGDRIVVERLEAEEKTKGGIVLPDTAKDKPKEGKVIAVGEGKLLKGGKHQPPAVKKGDRVLFASFAGDEFEMDNKKVLIMREEDILAIVK